MVIMQKGRLFGLFVVSLMLSAFVLTSVSFVSASAGDDFVVGVTGFIDGFKQITSPIFASLLGTSQNSSEFVVQILAFLLVTLAVFGIVDTTGLLGGRQWISFSIGVIISLIGIRFLPEGFLTAMAIPSSAFVAVMVLVLPFIVLFLMIANLNALARKVIWLSYAVLVVFLWFYNWNNSALDGVRWIYPVIAILCCVLFGFDATIKGWMNAAKSQRAVEDTSSTTRDTIVGEIRNLQSALAAATTQREIARISAELARKRAALAAL